MGEGGMDKSAPPAQLHAPPAQRGLFMFGKSFLTPGIHFIMQMQDYSVPRSDILKNDKGFMEHFTRQTLLQKIKDVQNEDSWNEFVEIYRPHIYVIIKNLGVRTDEIEDHVQSTMVICWQKLPDFHYEPDSA